ncbi:hypothetical protein [Mucilaginibacter gotjawali]|uniref:Uncharacterized protein n=1 Tax=Mucilaginibacter gotjawali TaxID=1550579 RepID=A0A839SLB0_9SPHI|nr:hypothetical protein [Mucilaginibacter gotjawali]MBB3058024.1 hypothetical protein [Mucilaginibacter gotjawali]
MKVTCLTHRGQILVEDNNSYLYRAAGTEPIRNAIALMLLRLLRTDGTLFVYCLFSTNILHLTAQRSAYKVGSLCAAGR